MKSKLLAVKEFEVINAPVQDGNKIKGRLVKYKMDYRNYGGSLWGTPTLVMFPMSADVEINLKDGLYVVTVSNMEFKFLAGKDTADNFFIKPNRKLWKKGEADNGALCITVALTKTFDINAL